MSKLDDIARALCEQDGEPWDELAEDDNGRLIEFPADRNHYRQMATAALKALRELGEVPSYCTMLDGNGGRRPFAVTAAPPEDFADYIDAILNEKRTAMVLSRTSD